jgi:RNA polymerase sigma-54 factor
MTSLAGDLKMHPSTVSRAVRNKYLQYPGGVCEIRSLFVQGVSQGISSSDSRAVLSREEIKLRLRKLIAGEAGNRPCSDQSLTSLLAEQGIKISRRTVAKYRKELAFSGMHDRRDTTPRTKTLM